MKSRKISLITILLTLCWGVNIIMGKGVPPVYAGVNYDTSSVSFVRTLPTGNYSVYVNVAGDLSDWISGYSTFSIIKNAATYLSISVSGNTLFINYTEERRLVITETGDYTFNFTIDGAYQGDYLNYEVLLAEIEIVYQPKTSIISEAPYGFMFVVGSLIGVAVINSLRRKKS